MMFLNVDLKVIYFPKFLPSHLWVVVGICLAAMLSECTWRLKYFCSIVLYCTVRLKIWPRDQDSSHKNSKPVWKWHCYALSHEGPMERSSRMWFQLRRRTNSRMCQVCVQCGDDDWTKVTVGNILLCVYCVYYCQMLRSVIELAVVTRLIQSRSRMTV